MAGLIDDYHSRAPRPAPAPPSIPGSRHGGRRRRSQATCRAPLPRPTIDDGATASIAPPVPAATAAAVAVAEMPKPGRPPAGCRADGNRLTRSAPIRSSRLDAGRPAARATPPPKTTRSDAASPGARHQRLEDPACRHPDPVVGRGYPRPGAGQGRRRARQGLALHRAGGHRRHQALPRPFRRASPTRTQARAACAYLTRQDFTCLALQ